MQAIRNMEPAWEKIRGLKFQLSSRTYKIPNGGTPNSLHRYEVQRRGSRQTGAAQGGTGEGKAKSGENL